MSILTPYRVRFCDTDAMEVVHHANYIRLFEMGRVEYLRDAAGITLGELVADGIVFPITEVKAKFVSPGHFDDEIVIETTAIALTRAKMVFGYRIMKADDSTVLVEGQTQNVFTSKATGKITRIPAKYYEKLAKAAQSEEQASQA